MQEKMLEKIQSPDVQKTQQNPEQEKKCLNAEVLAKIFKYYKSKSNPYISDFISYDRVKYASFYKKYKKTFDKLFQIISKYKLNHENFIQYCVCDIQVKNPKEILNVQHFVNYANKLKSELQYKKIYDRFIKSAKFIAKNCIIENLTPKEYFLKLIQNKRLAIEYMCGNISTHYLASIRGIKNISKYLDENSKGELSIIFDATEKLNGDIQEAFIKFKSHYVSPFKYTEELIRKTKNKLKIKQTKN